MNFAYGQLSHGAWIARDSVVGGPLLFSALVNKRGVRFIAEDHYAGSYYAQVARNPYYFRDYETCYMVFDQQTYDQMEEISEVGADVIVAQAETIGALAELSKCRQELSRIPLHIIMSMLKREKTPCG